jgi:hypothetical protein
MFDKNYPNRKDIRKPFIGAKAIDCSCRNHGRCNYCTEGRQHFDKKKRIVADQQLKEMEEDNV